MVLHHIQCLFSHDPVLWDSYLQGKLMLKKMNKTIKLNKNYGILFTNWPPFGLKSRIIIFDQQKAKKILISWCKTMTQKSGTSLQKFFVGWIVCFQNDFFHIFGGNHLQILPLQETTNIVMSQQQNNHLAADCNFCATISPWLSPSSVEKKQ